MKEFLVYVAASFLLHWGPALQHADFQVQPAAGRSTWPGICSRGVGHAAGCHALVLARCGCGTGQLSWALYPQSSVRASADVWRRWCGMKGGPGLPSSLLPFCTWGDAWCMQEMVLFLQKPPTSSWTEAQIELILSRAYMWRTSFNDAKSHLGS